MLSQKLVLLIFILMGPVSQAWAQSLSCHKVHQMTPTGSEPGSPRTGKPVAPPSRSLTDTEVMMRNLNLSDGQISSLGLAKILVIESGAPSVSRYLAELGAEVEATKPKDSQQIPKEDNSYQLILSHLEFNQLKNESQQLATLREQLRVVRPGGELRAYGFKRDLSKTLLAQLQSEFGSQVEISIREPAYPPNYSRSSEGPWFQSPYYTLLIRKITGTTKEGVTVSRLGDLKLSDPDQGPQSANPTEIPGRIRQSIQTVLSKNESFRDLASRAFIAINLSMFNNFEFASYGIDRAAHQRLFETVRSEKIPEDLAKIPKRLRLHYLVIQKNKKGELLFSLALAKDLPVQFPSHWKNGFAVEATADVVPFDPADLNKASLLVRRDLMNQNLSQETMATCGLASVCKVLNSRGGRTSEWQLFEKATRVRPEKELLTGSDPGLSLEETSRVLTEIQKTDPRFDHQIVLSPKDSEVEKRRFRALVQTASDPSRKIDLIVNVSSPHLGRPGAGHYLPVAGYDPGTDRVLLAEVNLSTNGPFWISFSKLYGAMGPSNTGHRGYVIIEQKKSQRWTNTFASLLHKSLSPKFNAALLTRTELKFLEEIGLAGALAPAKIENFYLSLVDRGRELSPVAVEKIVDEYANRALPQIAQSLEISNRSAVDTSHQKGSQDLQDMVRGFGYLLLPRWDPVFNDPEFIKKLVAQRNQTASGYPKMDPNNIATVFQSQFLRLSEGLNHKVIPVANTLTGSDANNLFYQIASWVVSIRHGKKMDGKILVLQGSYGGGRGPLRDFRFFEKDPQKNHELSVPAPLTLKTPSEKDLSEPLTLDEIKSLVMIAETFKSRQDIGGLLIEPIQSANGVRFFRANYMLALRQLCEELEIPILADEIFNGGGRTGKPFGYLHYPGFIPDYVSFGKGFATAGIAEVQRSDRRERFTTGQIMNWVSRHRTLYGLGPGLVHRVFDGTIDNTADALLKASTIIERVFSGNLIQNAADTGRHFLQRAEWFYFTFLERPARSRENLVRGSGLLLAIDGYRYQPAITLTRADVDQIVKTRTLEILESAVAQSRDSRQKQSLTEQLQNLRQLDMNAFLEKALALKSRLEPGSINRMARLLPEGNVTVDSN